MSLFTDQEGYQQLNLYGSNDVVCRKVHRLVLEAFVGLRPPECVACHNNGDPADNRVENLRWDTYSANCADTRRHGRLPRGIKHWNSKLTPDDVCEIRNLYASGEHTTIELGDRFGVCQTTIGRAIKGEIWDHIDGALADADLESLHSKILNDRIPRGVKSGRSKLTPDDVREIRSLYASGNVTQQELADQFDVACSTIGRIIRREYWRHIE